MAVQSAIKKPLEFTSEIAGEMSSLPRDIGKTFLREVGLGGLVGSEATPKKEGLKGEISLAKGINQSGEKIAQKEQSMEKKMQQLQHVQRMEREQLARNKGELQSQIQSILAEIKAEVARIQMQTAELTGEVRAITVDQVPKNAGKYHINFFEYVIQTLRDIRTRVNESRMWLNLWSRKKHQNSYWGRFKAKGGMEWAMNEERALATSNG